MFYYIGEKLKLSSLNFKMKTKIYDMIFPNLKTNVSDFYLTFYMIIGHLKYFEGGLKKTSLFLFLGQYFLSFIFPPIILYYVNSIYTLIHHQQR